MYSPDACSFILLMDLAANTNFPGKLHLVTERRKIKRSRLSEGDAKLWEYNKAR